MAILTLFMAQRYFFGVLFGMFVKTPTFVINTAIMDWLFRPLGKFMEGTFGLLEGASWYFDLFIVFTTMALIVYWFGQILKHRRNDKGIFKKS